ncbi:MAG: helix-turn-helix transcriptional regulator [Lachnospiraceae bacterium]|nr:helix-turn-helix transcriptional regulator [Lachnospiraceae bacterium]
MFGEQLKTLRLAKNISQVEFAKKLGVSKQSVSNWENNNILPSIEMLKKIAVFFSCSTDYLLELEENRMLLETTGLTLNQLSHIQELINDLRALNSRIPPKTLHDYD